MILIFPVQALNARILAEMIYWCRTTHCAFHIDQWQSTSTFRSAQQPNIDVQLIES